MIEVDTIKRARQADLAEYLRSRGERLVRVSGETYCLYEHDSLRITGNRWKWFSQQTGGNSIDFLISYYGLDFKTAVKELTGACIPIVANSDYIHNDTYQPDPQKLPKKANNTERVYSYLHEKRGLDNRLITDMIECGLLYQDVRGNAVFVIRDFENEIEIGYELRGTTDVKFARISKHRGFGFHILCGEEVDSIFFFESAIDLLSYKQFYRPYQNELLVSMGGLNPSVADNTSRIYPNAELVICTDNDPPGNVFASKIAERFSERTRRKSPPEEKDWNDFFRKRVVVR